MLTELVLERRSIAGGLLEERRVEVLSVTAVRVLVRFGLGKPPEFALHTGLPVGRGSKRNPWRISRASLTELREAAGLRGAS